MIRDDACRRSAHGFLAGAAKDRTFKTLVLALVLIGIMGMLRPDKPRGIYPKRYWARKISWHQCADAVLAGDSRVLGGVSPAEMRKTLADWRILNYGFASNLYVPEYLEALESLLDPESRNKALILGITPHSLTEDPDVTGQFAELKGRSRSQIYADIFLAPLLSFVEYMSFQDALHGLFPALATGRTQKEFHADGWLAYQRQPPGEKRELKKYFRGYQKVQVSAKMVEGLNRFVSRWTQTGIRVYAFLMPTCQEMFELEQQYSGFDQRQFVEGFEKAGGIWIDVDPCAYESFDGSHLQSYAARQLSNDLAQRIRDLERRRDSE